MRRLTARGASSPDKLSYGEWSAYTLCGVLNSSTEEAVETKCGIGARASGDSGGVGFTHYMVRRHVSKATADAVNKTLGGQATFYGQNY